VTRSVTLQIIWRSSLHVIWRESQGRVAIA